MAFDLIKYTVLAAVAFLLIISGAQAFWPRHFGSGAVVATSVWTSPLGSTITYPTGSAMGAVP
jgi:hypothetical protein